MYEKNFKKGTDLYEYCLKIEEFFNEKFGKFVAQHIWKIYQKKLNIEISKIKTVNEFMHLSNSIIEDVFSKHKKIKEVESIKLQLNMGFYISQVTKQLKNILKNSIKFGNVDMKNVTKRYLITYLENIKNYSITNYEINGVVEGRAFLFINQPSLRGYAEEFVKTIVETREEQVEMLKEGEELITKEFCNVLVTNFTDTIANTVKQTITPIEDNENKYYDFEYGKKKILNKIEKSDYSKIMKGIFNFEYGIQKSDIEIFFFFKQSEISIDSNVNKMKWEDEIKENSQEELVKKIENEYIEFIEKYADEVKPIELKKNLLKHLGREFITEIKDKDIKESLEYMRTNYFNDKTELSKKFILNGLRNIFEKLVEVNKRYAGV